MFVVLAHMMFTTFGAIVAATVFIIVGIHKIYRHFVHRR